MTFSDWFKRTFNKEPRNCSADPGIDALLIVIRLVSKVSQTTFAVVKGSVSPIAVLLAVGSLVPDVARLITEYEDLPCELRSLDPKDYEALIKAIMVEFGFDSMHAKDVLDTSIDLVADMVKLSPDVRTAITEITQAVIH